MSLNSFFNPFGKCLIFLSKQTRTMFKHIKGCLLLGDSVRQLPVFDLVWQTKGLQLVKLLSGFPGIFTALLLGMSLKQNLMDVSFTHLSASKVTEKKNHAEVASVTFNYKHESCFKLTCKDSFSYSTNQLHCSGQSSNRHLTTQKKSLQELSLDCWTATILAG